MNDHHLPTAEYAAPAADSSLDDVLGMRRSTLQRKLALLEEQITQAEEQMKKNLLHIDYDLCACGTLERMLPYHAVEERNRIILSSKLPLYKERRQRATEFLRDTAMLRREVLDTLLQYYSLEDQQRLLE